MNAFRQPASSALLLFVCAWSLRPLFGADNTAPTTPLQNLVQRYTDEQAAGAKPVRTAEPLAQTIVQPTALPGPQPAVQTSPRLLTSPVGKESESARRGERKPSPPLASLPAPKASGPLRILLVDDDASPNNTQLGTRADEGSDTLYRALVAAAVRNNAAAWSVEVVGTRANGPAFERLREFNVILWYSGGAYGANNDTVGREDEKTLRRYLEEVGGSVIIISPGYVNNLVYGQSWDAADHPFLKEVIGVNGCYGLAQRFAAGEVQSPEGVKFRVAHPGPAETQFSVVNPDGAALVFTSPLETAYAKAEKGSSLPVAVANSYGSGRVVYVGFTFENIPEQERTSAFEFLLSAARGAAPVAATDLTRDTIQPVAPKIQTITPPPAPPTAPPGPPPTNLEVTSSFPDSHEVRWLASLNEINGFEVARRDRGVWKVLAASVRAYNYSDRTLLAPNTAYKVTALYRDGRRGEAILEYPNPPAPGIPTGLKVVQTGPQSVRIDWTNIPKVNRYRIFGPGAPAAGTPIDTFKIGINVTTGSATMDYMPPGIHEIRVAADFGDNPLVVPQPATAKVAINSNRGRYRLVFRGVTLTGAVADDILDADGKGNEIFAAAMLASADPKTGAATRLGLVETAVYGDTQNFPGRIRAGTAGATGGLRVGDSVPDATLSIPQVGLSPLPDRFPLIIWEGELIDNGPLIAVVPIMIEWNSRDHSTLSTWLGFWNPNGNSLSELGEAMRQAAQKPLAAEQMYAMTEEVDRTRTAAEAKELVPHVPGFTPAADRDRIIGLLHTSIPKAFTQSRFGHRTLGFVLNRSRVETALAGNPMIVLEHTWSDVEGGGGIRGYFQLERLSAPPFVVPPAADAPLVAATTSIPLTVGGQAIVTPATTPPPVPTITQMPPGGPVGPQTIKEIPPPPAGRPPTRLGVISAGPARQAISWIAEQNTKTNVFRRNGDEWVLVVADTTFDRAYDDAVVPKGTVYKVNVHYPDGSIGSAEVTHQTPFEPKPVVGLGAKRTSQDKVTVSWKLPDNYGASRYRLFAPGLPPEGQIFDTATRATDGTYSLELANVPDGNQPFRVAIQYDAVVSPVDARIIAEIKPWSIRYRMLLLGVRIQRKTTDDDIFDADGRGDEVFFGAYRISIPDRQRTDVVPFGFAQSQVRGDVSRFPGRVQLGTAGPSGGLRSGDVLPSAAALQPQPGIIATNDRLPLLLWEGWLTEGRDAAAVAVTAFEWDSASTTAWNKWQSWWSSPAGSSMFAGRTRNALAQNPDEIRFVPLTDTFEVQPDKPLIEDKLALPPPPGTPRELRYRSFVIEGRPLGNRPIGALKREGGWFCIPHGFALTRNNLEKTLRGQPAAVIEASLRTHRGPDVSKPEDEDEAEYTIIVQVERLP